MERYGGGSIVVSDYNPAWSATFEQERTSRHCQVDEGGLLSFNLALLDGGKVIGTR
jgi:hypothetical protein